ncbi:hypothetical protein GE107_08650 [Cohnella sp. CFH 77786]|uniref:hypothetical protein n=1 Tax=Cohnella sp. CFH 77786 TaxID=2662265 RepID=UPI001C60EEB4|nr:hypothetical protein [Cohnella sp. CFH 77786]MBW5446130.1 hypothetical protein [Cohnella sp. CFH 77786]
MQDIEDYREELELIFAEASEELAGLPAGLSERGRDLLALSNPLRNGGRANRISYLLPYWIREQMFGPIELTRDLAVGNLFAMLRFFVLDDAMDGSERNPEGIRGSLALGPLLDELFKRRYHRHFPHDSALWDCYRRYLREWASAVYSEMANPIDPSDFGQLARKAAPVKLCASGMVLQAGRTDRIPDIEEAVDLALAVLQLSDDWADWRDDLSTPNGNAFLSIVRSQLALSHEDGLNERSVRRAIFHHHAADRLAEIAESYVEKLRRVPGAPDRLTAFAHAIAEGIRRDALHAEETRQRLAEEGGLAILLSKLERI